MATTTKEDQILLQQLKTGDERAFRALFNSYYKYLVVTCNNILGDSETARDLAQDVLADLWKRRDQMEIKIALKPYLRRAVVNKTLNYIKARRLKFTEPEKNTEVHPLENSSGLQVLEQSELQNLINTAIASLPEKCRLVFTLCRLEGMSHKEIAAQLEISTKTVENQMTKALKTLKAAVRPYLDRPMMWLGLLWSIFEKF